MFSGLTGVASATTEAAGAPFFLRSSHLRVGKDSPSVDKLSVCLAVGCDKVTCSFKFNEAISAGFSFFVFDDLYLMSELIIYLFDLTIALKLLL